MQKQVYTLCIILTLLVSSIGIASSPASTDIAVRNQLNALSSIPQIQRVYGEDVSDDIWYDITERSYTNYVRTLTENGSRWIASPRAYSEENEEAREYIIEELNRVSDGRIEVEVIGDYQSVVGRLPGYLPVDAPAFMIGGHYDSVPQGPGANDDGTGVAAMLEIARVMSQYQWPLDIYFGAWNAEEIGLRGSLEVAQEFHDREVELLVYYNVDMLLVPDTDDRTVLMVYPDFDYHTGKYWADLTAQMSNTYGEGRIELVGSSDFSAWTRSDHWSFIQNGYGSSLFAHESGGVNDIWYHQSTDVWSNPAYDYEVATEGVRAIGAAIAFSQARAYHEPVTGKASFNLQPDQGKSIYMTISEQTTINVSCRWWGGAASFTLFDPQGTILNEVSFDATSPWEASLVLETPVSFYGVYELYVYNHLGTTTGYEVTLTYESDINNNGIPDSQEFWIDSSLFSMDQDGDSLSDAYEMIIGTNWLSPDSDSDQLPDDWELEYNLDPLNPDDANMDEDGDTLTNLVEYSYGSNPLLVDSDADKLPDKWEIENGLNPMMNDASEDPDNDHISNLEEYLAGTDPNVPERTPLDMIFLPSIASIGILVAVVGLYYLQKKRWETP